jgi:hypothetical protein
MDKEKMNGTGNWKCRSNLSVLQMLHITTDSRELCAWVLHFVQQLYANFVVSIYYIEHQPKFCVYNNVVVEYALYIYIHNISYI